MTTGFTNYNETSLLGLIQAGLVWSATTAWSDSINSGVDIIYPNNQKALFKAKITYALVLTLVVVIIFYYLNVIAKNINTAEQKVSMQLTDIRNQIITRELQKSSDKSKAKSSTSKPAE